MSKPVMIGGIGQTKPIDDIVIEICQKVRNEVEEMAGIKYSEFSPIEHKTQLVNGVNYFIKVRVSDEKFIHIRAHRSFNGETISFRTFEDNKALEEDITYFE